MNPPELISFKIELEHLREFLLDLLESEDQIADSGFRSLLSMSRAREITMMLPSVETRLYECKRIARSLSEEVHSLLSKVLEDNVLIPAIAQISVEISIAERDKRRRPTLARALQRASAASVSVLGVGISTQRSNVFSDAGQIPVKRMLADLGRLIPALAHLYRLHESQISADAELLRPSNINVEYLQRLLLSARDSIYQDVSIDAPIRDQVVQYLTFVSVEIASEVPAWRKLVGALVIVSTILSGLAAAPDAQRNVQSALKHLLGAGIEKQEPPNVGFLPNTFDI